MTEPIPTTDSELLSRVRVAAPCSAAWDKMPGGEQVRSCEQCRHKVYNLSGMTAREAADLVRASEGKRVCVRFYRRADGKMMTQDCPTGVRAVRRRIARGVMASSASVALIMGINLAGRERSEQPRFLQAILNRIDPPAVPIEPMMGAIALSMAPETPATNHFAVPAGVLRAGNVVMGKVRVAPQTSFDKPEMDEPVLADKSFLVGSEIENAPREDPFTHQPKPEWKRKS